MRKIVLQNWSEFFVLMNSSYLKIKSIPQTFASIVFIITFLEVSFHTRQSIGANTFPAGNNITVKMVPTRQELNLTKDIQ